MKTTETNADPRYTLAMTTASFLIRINSALQVLNGRKFENMSQLHNMVDEIVSPLLPAPLIYKTWHIGVEGETKWNPFDLSPETKDDKRKKYNRKGKIISLKYKQVGDGLTLAEVIKGQKKLIMSEQIAHIKTRINDAVKEVCDLKKGLVELEAELKALK